VPTIESHGIMETIGRWMSDASSFMWGPWLVALLFGVHLFLTVRLGFVQRFLGRGIRISLQRSTEGEGDISQFGALTTALAATIGTGNIVGVATAVAYGGPGAVLWMWLTGVFGIATKYAEALLAVHYRIKTPNVRPRARAGPALAGPPLRGPDGRRRLRHR
jgi:AGCS family alanine or glycine:cation symporter